MPDAAQEILLSKHFGCVRVVYNHFLNERIEQYKKEKKSDNYHAQALALTQLKKKRRKNLAQRSEQSNLAICLKIFGYSLC